MAWDLWDFAIAGFLLIITATAIRHLFRRSTNNAYRIGATILILGLVLLAWVNGAVGIIGSENNPANLMYVNVPIAGLLCALITKFTPKGLSFACMLMAITQLLVALIAVTADLGAEGPSWPRDIMLMTIFFCVIWSIAAGQFLRADKQAHL